MEEADWQGIEAEIKITCAYALKRLNMAMKMNEADEEGSVLTVQACSFFDYPNLIFDESVGKVLAVEYREC